MMGKVKIIAPGLFSTIQDEGRFGFAEYGVPFSGAMDQNSYYLANALLGNHQNDACIEWVFQPPVLQFDEPTIICITGAATDCFLNDEKVLMNRQIRVNAMDVLTMKFCKNSKYGYVGIKHGFQTKSMLNSRSFFNGVTPKGVLKKDDEINYTTVNTFTEQFSTVSSYSLQDTDKLVVYKGPEFDNLDHKQRDLLFNSCYTISGTTNRMAIQLEEVLPNNLPSMLTSPVLPGTVQLTPSGKLIVLMRDCQTTGGYPRILQLSKESINAIAQKRAQEKFRFRLSVDFEE